MIARVSALLLTTASLCLSACGQGDSGGLQPLPSPGVALVPTRGQTNDTARVSSGGVTADATGYWGAGGTSIEVIYQAGPTPVRVRMIGVASRNGETARLNSALDQTTSVRGTSSSHSLLSDAGGMLQLKAGERRKVTLDYDAFNEVNKSAFGGELSLGVPMPSGPVTVKFRCAG